MQVAKKLQALNEAVGGFVNHMQRWRRGTAETIRTQSSMREREHSETCPGPGDARRASHVSHVSHKSHPSVSTFGLRQMSTALDFEDDGSVCQTPRNALPPSPRARRYAREALPHAPESPTLLSPHRLPAPGFVSPRTRRDNMDSETRGAKLHVSLVTPSKAQRLHDVEVEDVEEHDLEVRPPPAAARASPPPPRARFPIGDPVAQRSLRPLPHFAGTHRAAEGSRAVIRVASSMGHRGRRSSRGIGALRLLAKRGGRPPGVPQSKGECGGLRSSSTQKHRPPRAAEGSVKMCEREDNGTAGKGGMEPWAMSHRDREMKYFFAN